MIAHDSTVLTVIGLLDHTVKLSDSVRNHLDPKGCKSAVSLHGRHALKNVARLGRPCDLVIFIGEELDDMTTAQCIENMNRPGLLPRRILVVAEGFMSGREKNIVYIASQCGVERVLKAIDELLKELDDEDRPSLPASVVIAVPVPIPPREPEPVKPILPPPQPVLPIQPGPVPRLPRRGRQRTIFPGPNKGDGRPW